MGLDIRQISEELGFEIHEYLDVLDVFLDNTPKVISKFRICLKEDNLIEGAELCHLIKGGASSIGMETISEIAEEMEKLSHTKRFDKLLEMYGKLNILVVELEKYRKVHYRTVS